jgi:hypothetical protein
VADLAAPVATELGPGAVLGSAPTQIIVAAAMALTAPAPVVSPEFGVQIAPGSMSFG